MYLSHLLVNVGANPDRPRPGRLWLRNMYRVHQRLCMAFPDATRKQNDPQFHMPVDREHAASDFPEMADVHEPRSGRTGFLFRIDSVPGGNPVILVQSANLPDWAYAFQNAHLLAAPVAPAQPFNPRFAAGERLRFRLKANPVRKACERSKHPSGETIDSKWVGKRIPVPTASLKDWLDRQGERRGFEVRSLDNILPGYVYFNKGKEDGQSQRLRSVVYDGVLIVRDSASFADAVRSGIGREKAFGFGLLSLARMSP